MAVAQASGLCSLVKLPVKDRPEALSCYVAQASRL